MTATALVVRNQPNIEAAIEPITMDQLPDGDVIVEVTHSSVNYKDALCLSGRGGLVAHYPHVPGIDFAGRVAHTDSPAFAVGDQVVLTGWRVGETRWGGYATHARVWASELVPLPVGLTPSDAMVFGTAGVAAMMGVQALEAAGLHPDDGEVLVTGATGGVGSLAVAILAAAGYRVAAATGSEQHHDYLATLGAQRIVDRMSLAETTNRPLESETWAGCLDNVGGTTLARVLGQMRYGSAVAALGLAGGHEVPAKVTPFLLRGVSLLGIDSVKASGEVRDRVWKRLASALSSSMLSQLTESLELRDVAGYADRMLRGETRGRAVVTIAGLS